MITVSTVGTKNSTFNAKVSGILIGEANKIEIFNKQGMVMVRFHIADGSTDYILPLTSFEGRQIAAALNVISEDFE